MDLSTLTAISPLDGRYWHQVKKLSPFFSELSLMRYRVLVEVEYFLALCDVVDALKSFKEDASAVAKLRSIYSPENFGSEQAQRIKEIERITNHDVKAVEYFIKEKFDEYNWKDYKEYVHFALTSQDINNTAIPLALKHSLEIYTSELKEILDTLTEMSVKWEAVPMLARTHGQPATPTRMGKELHVFVDRIKGQLKLLEQVPFTAKFGGATGQFNAHAVAYPNIHWPSFADKFIQSLGLQREQWTTQISQYDNLGVLFDTLKRINTIWIDFCRDLWTYISMEYFVQKIVANEVGSSAMPHKVNPIDFENAEGNLGIANAVFEYLSAKLPISRLQRDLTDSTTLRNLGVPMAHTILAFASIKKGLGKLILNEAKIRKDLEDNWIVISEAIQTVLRREGFDKPYEAVKALTRTGEKVTAETFHKFVDELPVSDAIKAELKAITPFNFIGQLPQ